MSASPGDLISDFPAEFIVALHQDFPKGKTNEQVAFFDAYISANEHRMAPEFLGKQVNGHKALLYYLGEKYPEAAEYYMRSAQNSTPDDVLYFHEHCMVARCYRLAGDLEKSEEWIMKCYGMKHLMPNAFELFDWLKEYVDLLDDTQRDLPAVYLGDIRWIIMETGMEIRMNEDDLKSVVREMKALNQQENKTFGHINQLVRDNQTAAAIAGLKDYIAGSRIRFYREMAVEALEKLQRL